MDSETKENLFLAIRNSPIFLIDTMNFFFRYKWVHKDLYIEEDDGTVVYTGSWFGICNLVQTIRNHFPSSVIILALDGYDKSRHTLNDSYKSQRPEHKSVYAEIPTLLNFLSLVPNVFVSYNKDYEADDAIGSISRVIHRACINHNLPSKVYILSNDKDMYQLVVDCDICPVQVIRKFGSGKMWISGAEIVTEGTVSNTFQGVRPKDLVLYRAITGDASDNLKGYYRFRKKNASIIASNFWYDTDSKHLIPKDGVIIPNTWNSFLSTITSDIDTLDSNYRIMKIKDFDFEVHKIYTKYSKEDILKVLQHLQMNRFYYYVK